MRLAGEQAAEAGSLALRWPEFYEPGTPLAERTALARSETGADALLSPADLRRTMGWDRRRTGPWVDHWARAPLSRAVTQLRRRSDAPAAGAPAGDMPTLSFGRWFAAATEYLPRPLGGAQAEPGAPLPVRV
jgi:hypothetical protein